VTPDGSKVYVANINDNSVSVIDTATNTVIATIPVSSPDGVAVSPDGSKVYVTNLGSAVSVIATATNTVIGSPIAASSPDGVAVTPDGSKVYVANINDNSVSVIDTATNTVIGSPIPVGNNPIGVAVTPDGSKVYVANEQSDTVSVITTATNKVIGSITVGSGPSAFGLFIQPAKPAPRFAGTPGKANCHGKSVSALAQQYGGLNNAAAALGFDSVSALQDAIMAFCGG
jgi:YVTN family beta-propeller protein